MDPTFQFQMAYIDWNKYGGSFRKLSEYPDNWASCVFTMCNDFTQKDLLKAIPQNGPWSVINEIRNARPLAEAKVRGQSVNPAAVARITACCHEFRTWADQYFASTTPPWERRSAINSTTGNSSGGHGCLIAVVIVVAVIVLTIIANSR